MTDDDGPIASENEHVAPQFHLAAYHCPLCGVLAEQEWLNLRNVSISLNVAATRCKNCGQSTYWVNERMVAPMVGGGPRPHLDMPADVKRDYEEARAIVTQSPRGAGSLLRLAAQKLVNDLVPGSASLDNKTARLVADGLPKVVAEALDVLRVVGNNAVHPGEMVLDDDVPTVSSLFELLNLIVEDRIARPERVSGLFKKLPQGARDAIAKRDGAPTAEVTVPDTAT
jgi:hypothetical protein